MGVPIQDWDQVRNLVDLALQHPREQRFHCLDRICPRDSSLRKSVESLLLHDDPRSSFLELPPFSNDFTLSEHLDNQYRMGQKIGPYRIIEFIASGGMGEVYKAVRDDDSNQLPLAVKLIRESVHGSHALSRFYRERQSLAALNHPNIASLLDGGTNPNGAPYLVMEYVDGQPIHHYCRTRSISVEQKLRLFCDVCRAVSHAHQRLIVHRDLKPANILVTSDNIPKLLDFGIAKLLDRDQDRYRTLTGEPRKAMTLHYASPEQILGRTITTSCDVYALGVILFELLTGQSPYGQTAVSGSIALEHAICQHEPHRPSSVAAIQPTSLSKISQSLRGDLDTIILTALQKEPERRYDSVESLRDDLIRHLNSLPIKARKITFLYRTSKLIKRHKATTAALLATLLSLAFGICALTVGLVRAQEETNKAARLTDFLRDTLAMADPYREGTTNSIARLLDDASQRIESEMAGEPLLQAEIHATLANSYKGLGRFQDAIEHWQKAAGLTRATHPTPDTQLARILIGLGQTYSALHNTPQAIAATDQALQLLADASGPDTTSYASALSARAVLHQIDGQLEQAITLHRKALTIRQANLPAEDHAIIKNLLELTTSLRLAGQLSQARTSIDKASSLIHGREQLLPTLHIDLLQQESSLTVDEGNLDIARKTMQRELAVRTTHFGQDHPSSIYCLMRLASLSVQQGELNAAHQYADKACNICQTTWSNPTPKYANALLSLAGTFWAVGDYQSAETNARKALQYLQQMHGPTEKPDLIAAQSTLAVILRDAGHYREAEKLLLHVLNFRTKWYGHDHRYTSDTLTNIASLYHLKGDYKQAEQFARQARTLRMQTLPPNHADLAEANLLLGQILTATGDLITAHQLLTDSLQQRTNIYPPGHYQIAAAQSALATCLTEQREFEQAEQLLNQSNSTLSEALNAQHKFNRLTQRRLDRLRDIRNQKEQRSTTISRKEITDPIPT